MRARCISRHIDHAADAGEVAGPGSWHDSSAAALDAMLRANSPMPHHERASATANARGDFLSRGIRCSERVVPIDADDHVADAFPDDIAAKNFPFSHAKPSAGRRVAVRRTRSPIDHFEPPRCAADADLRATPAIDAETSVDDHADAADHSCRSTFGRNAMIPMQATSIAIATSSVSASE